MNPMEMLNELLDYQLNGKATATSVLLQNMDASQSTLGAAMQCAATAASLAEGEA